MTKQRKVFFFIGTLSKGGAERTVSNLTLQLSPDLEREIILFGSQTRIDYPFEGNLRYIDQTRRNSVLNKFLTIARRAANLKRLKLQNPDATFISFLEYPNLLNLLTSREARTIISVRNHMSTKHQRGIKAIFWKSLIKLLYHRADLVVAVSEDIRQDLIANFKVSPERIKVIYNYYDLEHLATQASQPVTAFPAASPTSPVITTMGRMNHQKGQWHLIRAFSQVRRALPDARLVLLGEGQYQARLQQLAADYGLQDAVQFAGFQANPHAWIAKSSVFVLPSLYEGFPNALAEAMACGVPVIAADCHSGPREILAPNEVEPESIPYGVHPGRFGLLYPVDSSELFDSTAPLTDAENQLAQLLIQFLQDPQQQAEYRQKALERISQFDIRSIVQAWEELINTSH